MHLVFKATEDIEGKGKAMLKNAKPWLRNSAIIFLLIIFSVGLVNCRKAGKGTESDKTGINSPNFAYKTGMAVGPQRSCSHPGISSPEDGTLKNVLILLKTNDDKSFEKVAGKVKEIGDRVSVAIAPQSLFALIPAGKENQLQSMSEVSLVVTGAMDPAGVRGLSSQQLTLLSSWNLSQKNMEEPTTLSRPKALLKDSLTRPKFEPDMIERHAPKEIPGQAAHAGERVLPASGPIKAYEPSTTMSGKVAVAVFFPESNGFMDPNQEDWTTSQRDTALSKIATGLDWWASRAPLAQNLSFDLYINYTPWNSACVATSYEPIYGQSYRDDSPPWIEEILNCLGYSSGTSFDQVDSFNTWLAGQAAAEQAFSVFVINDEVDSDHAFSDGYMAYAYFGGPFMILTYNNGNWGIDNLDWVLSHETGHIFWALDEYAEPGYYVCTCADSHLGCPNSNCENSCLTNFPCVMKNNSDALCDCTKGQIGWGCGNCSPPAVCVYTITSPDGGENWMSGSLQTVTWTEIGAACGAAVKLEYSINGGSSWINIIASTPNDGSQPWTVPNNQTTQARVRVTDNSNPGYSDESSANFIISSANSCGNLICENGESYSICPSDCHCGNGMCDYGETNNTCSIDCAQNCSYTMTSPDGTPALADDWLAGSVHNITWTASGICGPSVNLRFYDGSSGDSKTCCWSYIVYGTANDGSYPWTIPNSPTTWAIVEVQDSNNPYIYDWNDFYLIITANPCGNGACDNGENFSNCPQDCHCGNGICDTGETSNSCINDCHCGNGICDYGETSSTCINDCHCGNGICDNGETNTTCSIDCHPSGPVCGNGSCESGESCSTCPGDCGNCSTPSGGGGGGGGGGCMIANGANAPSTISSATLSYALPLLVLFYLKRKNRPKS